MGLAHEDLGPGERGVVRQGLGFLRLQELAQDHVALQRRQVVDEEHAVQVIHLVLDAHGKQALGIQFEGLAVAPVLRLARVVAGHQQPADLGREHVLVARLFAEELARDAFGEAVAVQRRKVEEAHARLPAREEGEQRNEVRDEQRGADLDPAHRASHLEPDRGRQEEEEQLQTQPLEEEEEELQPKLLQRQEEEEAQPKLLQRQPEEEEEELELLDFLVGDFFVLALLSDDLVDCLDLLEGEEEEEEIIINVKEKDD